MDCNWNILLIDNSSGEVDLPSGHVEWDQKISNNEVIANFNISKVHENDNISDRFVQELKLSKFGEIFIKNGAFFYRKISHSKLKATKFSTKGILPNEIDWISIKKDHLEGKKAGKNCLIITTNCFKEDERMFCKVQKEIVDLSISSDDDIDDANDDYISPYDYLSSYDASIEKTVDKVSLEALEEIFAGDEAMNTSVLNTSNHQPFVDVSLLTASTKILKERNEMNTADKRRPVYSYQSNRKSTATVLQQNYARRINAVDMGSPVQDYTVTYPDMH